MIRKSLFCCALLLVAGTANAQSGFDLNAWKAQYGTALTPSQFYTSRPGPWGDYFSTTSVDCANATFLYLGPLGVKARPYDQALSTAAFAALYPNTLVDATGLMQNAFGVMDVPAGGPSDGMLYPGDVILEMEDQRIKTATDISFPFPIQAQSSRGLEIHAGQLVDAAEGRGAIKMKVARAARSAWAGPLMTAPITGAEQVVDVTGFEYVRILTTSANNALANWINPRLENGSGGVLYLNSQTIIQKSGYASPIMGKDATNATVFDGATTITNCIGTRANSMIEYAVPAGYTTLKFKVQTTGTGSITPSVRTRMATLAVTQPSPRQYDGNGAPVLAPELLPYLETIEYAIPQIGSFGGSYDPNSQKVANYSAILAERLAREQLPDGSWPSGGGDYANPHFRTALAGLGLLATGDAAFTTQIQKAAAFVAANDPGGWAYPRGTRLMFLAEYYLRTRDAAILPGLQSAVTAAEEMITADFTCGHGLNMGYGGAGYIGATGTIGTGLAIASKTPVVVDLAKLDNLLERVQELAGGNGGGLPYSRGGIGRTAFPTEPSAGQSYSCGAGGVLATKIRGGPQYITELFRKKFGAATTYGDADGGHASEALTFIMGSLACQIWGDDAHKSNMDRFLWRLTLKRDYSGYINLNTNRLEYHGGDGGCHGGPTYDTGGYLVLMNSHKHNLAITGQPDYQATVFPNTPPTYDVDRKLYWRILNNWNMVDAALGSKMPATLQPKLAELRGMALGSDLGARTLAFVQREALAAATLVNGVAGLTTPEKQYYCEMLLGIGHDVTVASIDSPVPATGVMSNYRFSLNGYIPSTTWSSWGGPSSAVEPAPGTQMTGSVTLTDPSGVYLPTPRVLNFSPGTLNPTTDFQVPVGTQVTMQAAFNYTVGGSLAVSYTREIIINPAVPFNVDSRAGDYTNVRKVWIPGNCPIPFEKWNMPVQLPSGITLPGASKNEGTIGFHTYDNGVLVTADDTYKAKIRGKPAGYWAISSDRWGECAILGVNLLSGPVLTTTAVSGITPASANSGGVISSDNGWPITRRGVCWSISPYPTIFDSKTDNGPATGTFTSAITGLQPGVIYHVRAYATNAVGTSYGANVIFTTAGSNGVWAIAGGGSWPVTANWTGGVDASGADGIADFGAVTPGGDATVTLDGARAIGGMIFGNAGYTGTWTIQPGAGGSLSLEVGSSGTPTVTVNGGSAALAAPLIGVDGLVKAGTGTLVLAATNTYTGATNVNAGTLRVTGAISAGSPVNIAAGATLTGTGSLGSRADIAGAIAPGVSGVGTLTVAGKLTLAGTTVMEINKSTGACDKLAGMTTLAYGGTLTVANLSGTLAAGDRFVLFSAGSYSGAFATFDLPALGGGLKWDTGRLAVDGSIQIGYAAAITGHPADQTVDQGMSATFDIAATGVPAPVFQWQRSTDGGGTWANLVGATGSAYTTAPVAAGDNNHRFRCLVSNPFVNLTSNVATLTVTANVLPTFTLHPASVAVTAAGQTATFTAAASGAPAPTLQWQVSSNAGASWTDIAGATGASYGFTTVAGDNTKAYRCVATNTVGSAASNPATLAITANPVWTNVAGGSWPVTGNWAGNTVATGSGVTADFSRLILPAPATVTLDGTRTIGNLIFGDAAAIHGWNLTTGTAGPLTLAVTSGNPVITVNNTTATLGAQLASAQGLVKNGAGTLVLAAANNITGGTTLQAGTLALNNGSALGGGTLVISGGALANTSGTTITLPGATTWNGDFAFSGPNPLTLSGTVTLGGNRALNVADGTLGASGIINGAFSLTKNGSGQLTLSAASTYSGGTVVNGGTLLSTSGGWYAARGIGTGALTVNSGATARFTNSHGFGVEPGGRAATINGGTLQFDRENYISSLAFTGGSLTGSGEARFNSSKTVSFTAAATGAVISTGMNLVGGTLTLNVADAAAVPVDLLVSGYINNVGHLVKSGAGLMKMTGSSTYSGTTGISAGTLQLAGGSLGSGIVTVASGATLSGSGSIAGATTVNGILTSGVDGAIGTLAFGGNLTLASTSITTMKITKSGGTLAKDVISTSGTLTCGGTLTVTASGDTLADGDMFRILPATTITGTFATVNLPALTGGLTWNTTRLYVDGTITVGNIPTLPTQTITFGSLPALIVGDVLVLQASASSGLPVIFHSSNPAVALIQYGDYLTAMGAGTTTITASQPGNASYQTATDVSRTLSVGAAIPAVSSVAVVPVTTTTASSGGTNIWDGGDSITERGVCWSNSVNPTVADNRTMDGTGTGNFSSTLTGLTGNATYYIRAYVKNSAGYGYGENIAYNAPLDGVWILNANGNWSTPANWSGGLVPQGYGSTANFATLNITGDRTVTLDTAASLGAMTFGDLTTASNNWILAPGTGGSLTMVALSGTPTITVNNQTATINTAIGGTSGLIKAGAGTLGLGASNPLAGPFTIQGGIVRQTTNNNTFSTGTALAITNAALEVRYGSYNVNWVDVASVTLGGGATLRAAAQYAADNGDIGFKDNITVIGTNTVHATGGSYGKHNWLSGGMTGDAGAYVNLTNGAGYGAYADRRAIILDSAYGNWTGYQGTINAVNDVTIKGTVELRNARVIVTGTIGLYANGAIGEFGQLTGAGTLEANGKTGGEWKIGNLGTSTTFTGVINGASKLTKVGAGALTLTNANLHTGGTTVAAGTLLVTNATGSGSGTGTVTVSAAGTLGGTGGISGPVSVAGTLAPGANGIGSLTVGNTLNLTGITAIELNKTGGTLTNDKVLGVTTLTLGGTLNVTATGDALAAGNSFTLFTATTFAGSFATVNLPALGANLAWDTTALATTGTISIFSTSLPQTITFGPLAAKTFGDPTFALAATASSGLAVTYASSNPAVATIAGNIVTITGAGAATITASQAGDLAYAPAPDVLQSLTVAKATQSLSFAALPNHTYASGPFALAATASSGLAVSYASSNPAVATVSGNTVTITGAGTTTITASQDGNANFLAATSVGQSLTIDKAAQTITFAPLAAVNASDEPFDLTATASSGLAVTYTNSNPAAATVTGITVDPVAAGSTIITAAQARDANYLAATSVAQTLTVNPPLPVITITTTGEAKEAGTTAGQFVITRDQITGTLTIPFTVSGTASSGTDYTALATSVTLPAGTASATITLTPVDDAIVDPGETVIVTIAANAAYSLGSPSAATHIILDNDGAQAITAPWSATNVGSVKTGNSSTVTYGSGTNGTDLFSITGSGSIGADNTSDGMHFVSRSVTGDCEIIARVATHSGTTTNQRVGVAIRADNTTGGAVSAETLLRGGTRSPYFVTRTVLNNPSTRTTGTSNVAAPYWVRLVRSGTSCTSFISANGSTWTQIGTAVSIPNMPATARLGLFVSSVNNSGNPTFNTATFDNVTVKQNIASVTASVTPAAEGTPVVASAFTVSRGSTPPATALAVPLAISGSATHGTDYTFSGGSVAVVGTTATVTIPAGQSQIVLTATPLNDLSNEGTESIGLAVVTSPAPTTYSTGTPASASVSLTDAPVATLATDSSPVAGGSASGAGTYYIGSNKPITATPASGWYFAGWTGDGIADSFATTTTVLIDGAKSVTANFARIQHLITVVAFPDEGGFVTGGGVYDEGDSQTITASASPGWQFTGWSGTGIANPADATTTVIVDGDKTLTAHFARIQHTLTVTTSQVEGGTVSGGGVFDRGSTQPITATPAPGWHFDGWSGTGIADPNSPATSVSIDTNKTVTANFAPTDSDANANGILDTWESANFGSTGAGENPANGDNDGDGVSNLLEYAFGTNPREANLQPVDYDLEPIGQNRYLRIEIPKNPAATNLIYTVETCGDLAGWSAGTTVIEPSDDNVLRARDTVAESEARQRFIRVKVRVGP